MTLRQALMREIMVARHLVRRELVAAWVLEMSDKEILRRWRMYQEIDRQAGKRGVGFGVAFGSRAPGIRPTGEFAARDGETTAQTPAMR